VNSIDPTTIFKQVGFVKEEDKADGHVRGVCPFCPPSKGTQGREGHFFINVESENKKWDCKRCGRSGGFQMFLQEVVKFSQGGRVIDLSTDRGISEKTLLDAEIGFMNGLFIVPVWDKDKKIVLNIKMYDGDDFKNAAGCKAAMYGLWHLPKTYAEIYIAEGEWDCLALWDMGIKSALGVPGASTFDQGCLSLFLGKKVFLLYDNDEAGKHGKEKAIKLLTPVASEIHCIDWPKGTPPGYDVRDVYTKRFKGNKDGALRYILNNCKRYEQDFSRHDTPLPDINMKPPEIEGIYASFKKWLHLPNEELLDVIFGTVIANRIPGDPVWTFIVAPPGGTKTEPLMALTGGAGIETLSSLTPSTLISGHNLGGVDPSLIPLLNRKTLIIKDFTSVMGLPASEREEILSILRDAYDGECSKPFGNGVVRRYKSTFGIIAGVTPAIETFTDEYTQLGERFLRWRNWISEKYEDRHQYIERALQNTGKEPEMRSELNGAAKMILLANYSTRVPAIDKAYSDQLIAMSQWISVMRGNVQRDKYRKNALYKPSPELATRICKELMKLTMGIAALRGELGTRCKSAARNVAKSSINVRYLDVIQFVYKKGFDRPYTPQELQHAIGLPRDTTDSVLDNLILLKVFTKSPDGKLWQLKPEYIKLTKKAEVLC
jgi:hypothetical protein